MRFDHWTRCMGLVALLVLMAGCATNPGATSYKAPGSGENPRTEAARVNTELGQKYLSQGKFELALEKLQRALANDPRYVDAHTVIAVLYESIGNDKLAEEHYRRATQLKPNAGDENNNYGRFLCKTGRYSESTAYFQRAVADPFYKTPSVAMTNAGTCALKGGNLEVAEQQLRAALDRDPDSGVALFQMANTLYQKQDFFRARAFMQRFEARGENNAESLMLARNIELRLGNSTTAQEYTKRLRRDFPESEQARALDVQSTP